MVLVKIHQIRMSDGTIVFRFFDDSGNEIGSRGVVSGKDFDPALLDEVLSMTLKDFYTLKYEGFTLPDTPSNAIEQVAKIAYEQFLNAKKLEEEQEAGVIT